MKYYVPKAATEVADDAMQIFGIWDIPTKRA